MIGKCQLPLISCCEKQKYNWMYTVPTRRNRNVYCLDYECVAYFCRMRFESIDIKCNLTNLSVQSIQAHNSPKNMESTAQYPPLPCILVQLLINNVISEGFLLINKVISEEFLQSVKNSCTLYSSPMSHFRLCQIWIICGRLRQTCQVLDNPPAFAVHSRPGNQIWGLSQFWWPTMNCWRASPNNLSGPDP